MYSKGLQVRERITKAGARLFYEQGYDHTSFSDISRAVGIPPGNFYNHFKTKSAILDAVIDYRLDDFRGRMQTWESDTRDPLCRLKRFVHMLRDNERDLVRFGCPMGGLNAELRKLGVKQKNRARKMFEEFTDWLEREFRGIGCSADEARRHALYLITITQGASTVAHVYGSREVLREKVDVIDRWLDAVAAEKKNVSAKPRSAAASTKKSR